MSWLQAKKKHRQALIEFILKNEWAHVSFSEKLKTGQHGYTIIADYSDASGRLPLLNFSRFNLALAAVRRQKKRTQVYWETKNEISREAPVGRAGGGAEKQASGLAGKQTGGRAGELTVKLSGGRAGEQAGRNTGELTRKQAGERTGQPIGESPERPSRESSPTTSGTTIESAVLFSQYGVMFPIFSEESLKVTGKLETYIQAFRRNIYSVMGIKRDVVIAEKLLKLNPHTEINYYLMVLTAENFFKKYNVHGAKDNRQNTYWTDRISIKRAAARDAKYLFPMERDYQLEEVIINPKNYNPKFVFSAFRNNLSKNIVLFAENDGVPVSKAGTNAQGFYTDQIGGVFTIKSERGRGFAREVMIRLLSCIFKDKKTASLFVKKQNIPAVKLYEHLGFTIKNDFRISYF